MHKGKNYCPHFGKCGGCNYLNLQYENELSQKKLAVENALAECEIDAPVSNIVPMFFPYKYRNNIHLSYSFIFSIVYSELIGNAVKRLILPFNWIPRRKSHSTP